jgi:flagellar motor protein MotB
MNVFEQDRAYRRGLVLGLTMAEIVTLVIFCLLLAFGVVLKSRQERLSELERQLDAVRENAELSTYILRDLQSRFPKAATLEDFKRVLDEQKALAEIADALPKEDSDVAQFAEDARLGAEARRLASERNVTAKEIVAQGARRAAQEPGSKWPPFFKLSEADGYFFKTGSAEPANKLQQDLKGLIAEKLVAEIREWDINVVEVVGHTDEQPLRGDTNLDLQLLPRLNGAADANKGGLRFSDNAGLGMARAAEVVRILRQDPRFQNVSILPLSAAQSIFPVDNLATGANSGDVKERRRIEIRLRRFSQELSSK